MDRWRIVQVAAVVLAMVSASMVAATQGIGPVNNLYQIAYPGAGAGGDVFYDAFTGLPCAAGDPNREDGWGIFKVTSYLYTLFGDTWFPNTLGNTVEYYGIYYGRIDESVVCDGSGTYTVQSSSLSFAIYENSLGTFDNAGGIGQGSAGRTGVDQYNGITGGTLMLSGVIAAGDPYTFTYTLDGDGTIVSGGYSTRLLVTGGAWYGCYIFSNNADGPMYSDNVLPYSGAGNWTTSADSSLRIGYLAIGFTTYDMTTLYAPAVPEPVTLGLLSIGGLTLLMRRRRK